MYEIFIGLTFIFIGSISFISRYIVGAIITSIVPTYSIDGYYSNVSEFGEHLLIFSIVFWIIGMGFSIYYYYRVKMVKNKEDNNED